MQQTADTNVVESSAKHAPVPAHARSLAACLAAVLAMLLLSACRQDMHDQPYYRPLAESAFYPDHKASRPFVEGTVARGHAQTDELFYTGRVNGQLATEFPFPVTEAVLHRGQERFNIYCSPCHGKLGNGQGMIVQRGLRAPPSYHIQRLREAPPGHFFDVITNGFGLMANYASRVPPADRWAIVAYIRALQFSQAATMAEVPADQLYKVRPGAPTPGQQQVPSGTPPAGQQPAGKARPGNQQGVGVEQQQPAQQPSKEHRQQQGAKR